MSSEIEICNQSLGMMGARNTILSFTEDTEEAIACSQFYETARKEVLTQFWWGFAKHQRQLTLLDQLPNNTPNAQQVPLTDSQVAMLPWLYKYAYPSDAIQARYLIPFDSTTFLPNFQYTYEPDNAIRYEVASAVDAFGNESKVIYTNEPVAILCYTRDIKNTAMFDTQFQTSLAHQIASYITMSLSGNTAIRDREAKAASIVMESAEESSANEGLTFQNHTPDWISARGYSSRMPGRGFGFDDNGGGL